MKRVLVVGASLAGLCTAEALRRNGYDGSLTLIGDEQALPYDRPPLSKQLLSGDWAPERTALRSDEALAALEVEFLLGERARALDPVAKTVELSGGSSLPYDALVVATGARPRSLPGLRGLESIHTLRTLGDALALRDALAKRPRVVIVGGGFVGAEVAAEARRRDLSVTLVEASPVPLSRGLGERMGEACTRLHVRNGVRVLCGRAVAGFDGDTAVERVRLEDGSTIGADLVVVGIGATPAVGWLADSGIRLDDGVLCDAYCRASAPDVYAAGDVARWFHPGYGRHVRLEHWTNAREQAAVVARNLLDPGSPVKYTPVPYVWSDQYGTRIQMTGRSSGDVRIVHEGEDQESLLALYRDGDRFEGALAINSARRLLDCRRLLARGADWHEALATAA
ncbi:NAD(P)/FAD-dependent oxidoreductase [Streptomyces sp. NPDC053560]|uniref:NAD(P)/FAD-dependent oxidoreductase n=1 Tax=Streptomyces sp. NPDC053560 TaxID=3365711 RepID=UPI0037D93E7E